jgi:hypothetical protein
MKKIFTQKISSKIVFIFIIALLGFDIDAATFRTLIGIQYDTPTLPEDRFWINSDTAFGETSGVEISYIPSGGGSAVYVKILGTFDNAGFPGANWRVDATYPAGATAKQYQLFTRNQSGSDYGFTGFVTDNALPVIFTSFNATTEGKTVKLSWSTAQEINNDYFEIERSSDTKIWESIIQKSAAENSKIAQNYAVTDYSAKKGANYYRLSQIDKDGTRSEYPRVQSAILEVNPDIVLYPNPTTDILRLSGINEDANVTILDLSGVLKMEKTVTSKDNSLKIASLSEGIYIVRIQDETSVKVMKIAVKR